MKNVFAFAVILLTSNTFAASEKHNGYVMQCDRVAVELSKEIIRAEGCSNPNYIGVLSTGKYSQNDKFESESVLHFSCSEENKPRAYIAKIEFEFDTSNKCIKKEHQLWTSNDLNETPSFGFELPCDEDAIRESIQDTNLKNCSKLNILGVLSTGEVDQKTETQIHLNCLDTGNRNFFIMRESFEMKNGACEKTGKKGWIWDRSAQKFVPMN